MREVKFRGRCFKTGKWIYGDLGGNINLCIKPLYSKRILVKYETVGQYTGVKDKNKNDIYEGDILRYDIGTKAEVIFKEGCFMAYDGFASSSDEAYLRISPDENPFDGGFEFEVEVIGNIHKDKDLLC